MNAVQMHAPAGTKILVPGNLVVTEAEPGLLEQITAVLPTVTLQELLGPLDLALVQNREQVVALAITGRSPLGAPQMDALPALKYVTTGSTSYDNIDVAEARARGILVSNVPDYGPAVAEFNILLMLALSRRLHRGYLKTLQDEFSRFGLLGSNISGKTLGLIGAGHIGRQVLEYAKPYGMRLLAHDPYPIQEEAERIGFEYVPMHELLPQADILAICCPLNEHTRHMIGREHFAMMKRGVLLVNTSRGEVLDTKALLWALKKGIVEGAALDVMESEGLMTREKLQTTLSAPTSPETSHSLAAGLTLMKHPRVIVTPHIAYFTRESLEEIARVTAANLEGFFHGRPQNLVPEMRMP
ncbi:MAG TPA: NAD(P)-dependent oxidoreductase [Fimbriimonadaceae bacterium]|nr:NAD(P)-dependent oxidoreductase [Fimbriimonadaceae bacterium]